MCVLLLSEESHQLLQRLVPRANVGTTNPVSLHTGPLPTNLVGSGQNHCEAYEGKA